MHGRLRGLTPTVILLGLGDQYLPRGKSGLLERNCSEVQISAPVSSAISPTPLDSPPAPLSDHLINPASLASRSMSIIFFHAIGSPIWTVEPKPLGRSRGWRTWLRGFRRSRPCLRPCKRRLQLKCLDVGSLPSSTGSSRHYSHSVPNIPEVCRYISRRKLWPR